MIASRSVAGRFLGFLFRLSGSGAVFLFAAALSSCGGDSGTGVGSSALQESQAQNNLIMHNDAPGVQFEGKFEAVPGYLSESAKVLRSVGAASATFHPDVPRRGFYEVFAWWPQAAAPGSAAEVVVSHLEGESVTTVDQSVLGGQWNSLGVFQFDPSKSAAIAFRQAGSAPLLVDAVRVQYLGEDRPGLALRTQELAIAEQDRAYSARLEGVGGVAPYTYRIADGVLPPGLALDSATGVVSGIPAGVGSHPVSIEITDAAGNRSTGTLGIEVTGTPDTPTVSSAAPSSGVAGQREKSAIPVAKGSAADLGALVSIVAAMPEGEWQKVNLNEFSNVWTPEALRPMYGWGNPLPSKIIGAWSSFAWDRNHGNLVLYGGGHANYRGNDVYIWRGATRMWERASLPSEMKQDALGNWNAIDGADHAPASAHTYDNNTYLPIVDRMLVIGGAADSNGAQYMRQDTATASRRTGPYLFDPSKADPDKVGGTTGSHVQRVAPHAEVVGGNMWSNRENYLNASKPTDKAFVNACSAYAEDGGKDAVYVRVSDGLYKYTLHELNNPSLDTWEKVGTYWGGAGSKTACGYDPVGKSLVRLATNAVPFVYWNLNTPGPNNRDANMTPTDPSGDFANVLATKGISIPDCGLDFDLQRKKYALWCGDGRVWMLEPPASLSPAGWTIRKQPTPLGATPNGDIGTGILGKWEYIPNLDAFMALQDSVQGNIWIYKPVGWQNPGGGSGGGDPGDTNLPPVVSIGQPAGGSSFTSGQPILISASASDSDGTVSKVEFFQGSTKIGEAAAAPFEMSWTNAPVGSFSLTAVATDDRNASAISAPVSITVTGDGGSQAGTVILQRGLNDYSLTADTYLSTYHKTLSFGATNPMQDQASNYSMLARFAIFQSEGGPVPNGATIQSAVLSFYKYSAYDVSYGAYRILKDWQETAANWNQASASLPWAAGGGNGAGVDYVASPDASASVGWDPGWLAFDVTAAVQAMSQAAPTANFGWRLRALSGNLSNGKKFYTSEFAGSPELRPKLVITYQ